MSGGCHLDPGGLPRYVAVSNLQATSYIKILWLTWGHTLNHAILRIYGGRRLEKGRVRRLPAKVCCKAPDALHWEAD